MTERRDFIKLSFAGFTGLALIGCARPYEKPSKNLIPGIAYTKKNPGRWSKKVSSHLPQIKVEGNNVTMATNHSMSSEHYIVRHTLVDENGNVLGENTFYPDDKKAESIFEISVNKGSKLYATSFCNLHDLWVNEFIF